MGTHAFEDSAFLLTLQDFYALLKPSHLHGIRNDAARVLRYRGSTEGKSGVMDDTDVLSAKDKAELGFLARDLSVAESILDVQAILESFIERTLDVHGTEIEEHQPLQEVFKCVCHVVLPIQPDCLTIISPEDVDMGDDPPTDTPLLWFNFETCFSVEMTAGGRQLARTLGKDEIEPLSWTSMG